MRLTFKITLFFISGICLVMAGYGYERISRETELFETQMRRDHYAIAQPLAVTVGYAWDQFGEEFALGLVETSNQADERIRIRWVWTEPESLDRVRPGAPEGTAAMLAEGLAVSWVDREQVRAGRLYTYIPVVLDQQRLGALELSESFERNQAYLDASKVRILGTTALIVLIASLIAWATGLFFIARPVEALIEKARAIGEGDLRTPLHLKGQGELTQLAREMNLMGERLASARDRIDEEMAARIEALKQLRHADRLKTVGTLAAGLAHELGTPLNVIAMRAAMIEEGEVQGEEACLNGQKISKETARITAIIQQLMDFARVNTLRREPLPLKQLVEQAIDLIAPLARKANVAITYEARDRDPELVAEVDGDQLLQVLTNLLVNAMHACDEKGGGKIEVKLQGSGPTAPGDPGEEVAILITDTGVGIKAEHKEKLFEPFFTTKEVGSGSGLGLSVSYGIVREHGGRIEVESEFGEGSCFTVTLPSRMMAAQDVPTSQAKAKEQGDVV